MSQLIGIKVDSVSMCCTNKKIIIDRMIFREFVCKSSIILEKVVKKVSPKVSLRMG